MKYLIKITLITLKLSNPIFTLHVESNISLPEISAQQIKSIKFRIARRG